MNKNLILMIGLLVLSMSYVSAIPNIVNISIEPENPTISDDVKICANVNDTVDIVIVRINLHADAPEWNWGLIMDEQTGNLYCKTMSPYLLDAYEGKKITYYLSARNVDYVVNQTETFSFIYMPAPEFFCGDGTCDADENCSICPEDCGACSLADEDNNKDDEDNDDNNNYRLTKKFCLSNWRCSEWSPCTGGIMTRKCYDTNNCEEQYNKPIEMVGCETPVFLSEKLKDLENWKIPFTLINLIITLVLLIILISLLKK